MDVPGQVAEPIDAVAKALAPFCLNICSCNDCENWQVGDSNDKEEEEDDEIQSASEDEDDVVEPDYQEENDPLLMNYWGYLVMGMMIAIIMTKKKIWLTFC